MSDTHALNNVSYLIYELRANFYVPNHKYLEQIWVTFFFSAREGLFVWEVAVNMWLFIQNGVPQSSQSLPLSGSLWRWHWALWSCDPFSFIFFLHRCINKTQDYSISLSESKVSGSHSGDWRCWDVWIPFTGGWRCWANRPPPLVENWIPQNLAFSSISWGKTLIFSTQW